MEDSLAEKEREKRWGRGMMATNETGGVEMMASVSTLWLWAAKHLC